MIMFSQHSKPSDAFIHRLYKEEAQRLCCREKCKIYANDTLSSIMYDDFSYTASKTVSSLASLLGCGITDLLTLKISGYSISKLSPDGLPGVDIQLDDSVSFVFEIFKEVLTQEAQHMIKQGTLFQSKFDRFLESLNRQLELVYLSFFLAVLSSPYSHKAFHLHAASYMTGIGTENICWINLVNHCTGTQEYSTSKTSRHRSTFLSALMEAHSALGQLCVEDGPLKISIDSVMKFNGECVTVRPWTPFQIVVRARVFHISLMTTVEYIDLTEWASLNWQRTLADQFYAHQAESVKGTTRTSHAGTCVGNNRQVKKVKSLATLVPSPTMLDDVHTQLENQNSNVGQKDKSNVQHDGHLSSDHVNVTGTKTAEPVEVTPVSAKCTQVRPSSNSECDGCDGSCSTGYLSSSSLSQPDFGTDDESDRRDLKLEKPLKRNKSNMFTFAKKDPGVSLVRIGQALYTPCLIFLQFAQTYVVSLLFLR